MWLQNWYLNLFSFCHAMFVNYKLITHFHLSAYSDGLRNWTMFFIIVCAKKIMSIRFFLFFKYILFFLSLMLIFTCSCHLERMLHFWLVRPQGWEDAAAELLGHREALKCRLGGTDSGHPGDLYFGYRDCGRDHSAPGEDISNGGSNPNGMQQVNAKDQEKASTAKL